MGRGNYSRNPQGRRRGEPTAEQLIQLARCPKCGAAKGAGCHRVTSGAFGVQDGGPCQPHMERWTQLRRMKVAARLTKKLR